MENFFEDDDYYTGPPLCDDLIAAAQSAVGFVFPRVYVEALRLRNGGIPKRRCFRTSFKTSWAPDHFEISAILGFGGELGIDSVDSGSRVLIEEWGYPDIGVVICAMPSGGHDAVMLDYSECGPTGVPGVAYVDEDRAPQCISRSFEEFIERLDFCALPGDP